MSGTIGLLNMFVFKTTILLKIPLRVIRDGSTFGGATRRGIATS